MKKKRTRDDFDKLLDHEYGTLGTVPREDFERRAEAFMLGVLIREARRNAKMTQEELAKKSGTKRSYISRIENDASDIRLSTLMRIVNIGLGAKLEINIKALS